MKPLYTIAVLMILMFGVLTSYTDIKYKRAYNKTILAFIAIGIGIQTASVILDTTIFPHTMANFVMTVAVSLLFYALKIWAAGDAKVFIAMVLLIPLPMYMLGDEILFPGFYILVFTFTGALLYVAMESILFFCHDLYHRKQISWRQWAPKFSKEGFVTWMVAVVSVDTCDVLLMWNGNTLVSENAYLLVLVNITIAFAVISLIRRMIWKIVILIGELLLRLILVYWGGIDFLPLTFWTIFVVIAAMFAQSFIGQYNYRTISTRDVSVGNVLSRSSILLMIPSAVKGLPKLTDETTRCRLTQSEVEAIKRWEHSKYGQDTVTIVRTVPFSPFIFAGVLLHFAFRVYLGA